MEQESKRRDVVGKTLSDGGESQLQKVLTTARTRHTKRRYQKKSILKSKIKTNTGCNIKRVYRKKIMKHKARLHKTPINCSLYSIIIIIIFYYMYYI